MRKETETGALLKAVLPSGRKNRGDCSAVAAGVSMGSTAVITAGMSPAMVMITGCGIRIGQRTSQQFGHPLVRIAGTARIQLDAGLSQSHLRSAANAAADQTVHAVDLQKTRQGAVAAAIGIYNPGGHNCTVFHFVKLELLCVAKVAEYVPVFIGDCDFHGKTSFPCSI